MSPPRFELGRRNTLPSYKYLNRKGISHSVAHTPNNTPIVNDRAMILLSSFIAYLKGLDINIFPIKQPYYMRG